MFRSKSSVSAPSPSALRRLCPPRACLIAVPLALAWGVSVPAGAEPGGGSGGGGNSGGGGSAGSGGGDSQGGAGAAGGGDSGFYEDTRPVITDSNTSPIFQPSGGGTSNPFGFASSFSSGGCARSLSFGDNATGRGTSRSVLEMPGGSQRNGGRYFQASVGGSETFSDNINLDSNDNADSDFVTVVAPRVEACSSTGRIRGQASYQLEGVVYANNSNYNDVYNDVQGGTEINLLPGHLYLDVNTEYGQSVIDPSVGYSRSNIIRPNDNKTSAWRTNISPVAVQSLGLLGQGMLRYRYGRSVYGDDDVPETTVNGVSASIASTRRVEPVSWRLQAVTQSVHSSSSGNESRFFEQYRQIFGDDVFPNFRDPNRTRHFDNATLQLGYRVTRTLKLTALGGIEDRYKDNGENDRWSSTRWQAGVRWDSAANSLEFNYGHRFYGASYSLYAEHRARLFDLSLSYQEEPSSPGLDALNNTNSGSSFGSVGSITQMLGGYGGYGNPAGYGQTTSLFDRGVYVNKRWQGRVSFDTSITQTDIRGYSRKRVYQSGDVPDASYYGAEIDTRYALTPRTSIVPSVRWEHQERSFLVRGAAEDDTPVRQRTQSDDYDAGVSVVRAISRSAQAAVGYTRSWRNDDNGFDYHENRVTLQFRKAF